MNFNVKQRSVGMSIFLSIITCGIYLWYWMVVLTDDVNYALNERDTSGAMCLVFTIITCGIYGFYWAYRLGGKVSRMKAQKAQVNGYNTVYDSSSAILYLVLQLFGLEIIVLAIAQHEMNNASNGTY